MVGDLQGFFSESRYSRIRFHTPAVNGRLRLWNNWGRPRSKRSTNSFPGWMDGRNWPITGRSRCWGDWAPKRPPPPNAWGKHSKIRMPRGSANAPPGHCESWGRRPNRPRLRSREPQKARNRDWPVWLGKLWSNCLNKSGNERMVQVCTKGGLESMASERSRRTL